MSRTSFLAVMLIGILCPPGARAQCPSSTLIQPDPHPANSAYPDPEVSGSCSGDDFIVMSNGIPGFEFQPITPGMLTAFENVWTIPIEPTLPELAEDIPLLGAIGFTTTGLVIVGPAEGPVPPPQAFGDPIFNGIVDFCFGHVGGQGDYHNHALLLECIGGEAPVNEVSPILGYGLDGFPIYGSMGCLDLECTQVVEFQSSYVQTGDPTSNAADAYEYVENEDPTFLDRCNGRIGPDGTYRYHTTSGYPYVLGCYAGEDIIKENGTDLTVGFSEGMIEAAEDDGTVTVTVELSAAPTGPVSVDYTTASGSAVAGMDFEAISGTLNWDVDDSLEQTLDVTLFDDEEAEGNETFSLALSNPQGDLSLDAGSFQSVITILDNEGAAGCVAASDVLCLQDARFKVEVFWETVEGETGSGFAESLSDSSGLFWFFSEDNYEMLLKVLDGCHVSGLEAYWVFFAAGTNVEFEVRVTDTATGRVKQYFNPQQQAALPVQDLMTFDTCP